MAWNPRALAPLLRTLAEELVAADGAARNGAFIELHRLSDNLFRLALENHPDASPALAARAFDLHDPLPAPQVVRELNALASPLLTPEIRTLYRHVNAARNNLVHDAVMGRQVVSMSNAKRGAELAERLARQLDPDAAPRRRPRRPATAASPQGGFPPLALLLMLALGVVIGLAAGVWLF